MAVIETLATDEDALSLLSEAMNFDFASKGLDEPFTDAELDGDFRDPVDARTGC